MLIRRLTTNGLNTRSSRLTLKLKMISNIWLDSTETHTQVKYKPSHSIQQTVDRIKETVLRTEVGQIERSTKEQVDRNLYIITCRYSN